MKITKKTLRKDGLQLKLSGAYDVTAVYVDKVTNYGNAYSSDPSKHTFTLEYKQTGDTIIVNLPPNTPTLSTITVISGDEVAVDMYLNDFSLFKAKTKYLSVFDSNCACNCNNSICIGCNEKSRRYSMMTYMLRIQLLSQCYVNNDIEGTIKYYIDACRIYDMDSIIFDFLEYKTVVYDMSTTMKNKFNALNTWIKSNVCNCEKKVLECLLIQDLYGFLFRDLNTNWDTEEPTEPTTKGNLYYGYLAMNKVKDYRTMVETTHDMSLFKESEILQGVQDGTITKTSLSSKDIKVNIPRSAAIIVLIPKTSSMKSQKFDGIGSFVNYDKSYCMQGVGGFSSNGQNTITIDNVEYKIYGEDSIVDGERTLRIK